GLEQSAIVQERAGKYQPKVTYPKTSLAESLQQCAALISADLGVRALSVGLGGFDTHSKQNMSREVGGLGFHDNLLKQVSDAVSAFYTDAEAQGFADRIVVLIFSEFGRTPNENGDQGTDHGYASVMFVVGGSVKGGVYGEYPSLDQSKLFIDNLDVNTDFRSVYSTLLANHLSVDPEQVLGSKFSTLSFI
ncbi:MAG: DUF1501 domain-containing protein, partial [Blastocatellia bacterium]|nr:DUF1501 domain-containing protein [Blastocatellia bacterium]